MQTRPSHSRIHTGQAIGSFQRLRCAGARRWLLTTLEDGPEERSVLLRGGSRKGRVATERFELALEQLLAAGDVVEFDAFPRTHPADAPLRLIGLASWFERERRHG
jgi:hypothetical protein